MLTLKSKLSEYLEMSIKSISCENKDGLGGLEFVEGLIKKYGDVSLKEALMPFDGIAVKAGIIKEIWIVHDIMVFGEEMDAEIRELYLSQIIDPVVAFHLHKDCPHLTDREDKILHAVFEGKLPNAEMELATGVVVRAKTVMLAEAAKIAEAAKLTEDIKIAEDPKIVEDTKLSE
jgi:hypothetical protein